MRAVLVLFCSGLLCGAALAADLPATPSTPTAPPVTPQVARPLDDATGADLAALFSELCVAAFPDAAALDARLAEKGAMAMTPEQVKAVLHDDPGRGWILVQNNHRFAVTEEAPPFHACSVRVNTPAGVPNRALSEILAAVTAKSGQRMSAPQVMNRNDDPLMGISAAIVQLSPPPAGADAEGFMAFVTTYRDRTTNAVLFVENRFVHQIHAAPVH